MYRREREREDTASRCSLHLCSSIHTTNTSTSCYNSHIWQPVQSQSCQDFFLSWSRDVAGLENTMCQVHDWTEIGMLPPRALRWTAMSATLHARTPVCSLCHPLQPGSGRNTPFYKSILTPQRVRFSSPSQPNSHVTSLLITPLSASRLAPQPV